MSYDSFCADIAKLYPIEGSLSEGAPPAPLGMKQRIPATATGFTHGFVVTATGVLAGSARFDSSVTYDSTVHSSFGLGAQEGEQLWILVANPSTGSTIERGTPVKWVAAADSTNLFYIQACAGGEEADQVIGVAQFDIPVGKAAYVLAYGVGKAVAGETAGSGKRGDALTMDAGAARVIESAGGSISWGKFLDDALTDGSLADVFLNCRI